MSGIHSELNEEPASHENRSAEAKWAASLRASGRYGRTLCVNKDGDTFCVQAPEVTTPERTFYKRTTIGPEAAALFGAPGLPPPPYVVVPHGVDVMTSEVSIGKRAVRSERMFMASRRRQSWKCVCLGLWKSGIAAVPLWVLTVVMGAKSDGRRDTSHRIDNIDR